MSHSNKILVVVERQRERIEKKRLAKTNDIGVVKCVLRIRIRVSIF